MPESTLFAPAERAPREELLEDYRRVASAEHIVEVFNALPYLAAVLNSNRQLFFVNRTLLDTLGIEGIELIIGDRPGEALDCIHASEEPGGCGTAEACRYCGAVNAILESQRSGQEATRECCIVTGPGGAGEVSLDLSVTAVPFSVGGHGYTLLALRDISGEKRRRSLERIFFHDVINSAVTLYAMIELLNEGIEGTELAGEFQSLGRMSEALLDEISAQRDLASAEVGDLTVVPTEFDCGDLAIEVAGQLGSLAIARGRSIEVVARGGALTVDSDRRLVRRVLINMVKNALEAAPEGSVVSVNCGRSRGGVRFSVHSANFMPRDVQLQVFQRSFSTRELGRGLGAYSMKLLASDYLDGDIGFETSEEDGTTFHLDLPLSLPVD